MTALPRTPTGNGVPDECEEACPVAAHFVADSPPDGAVDARKPHPSTSETPVYGIGMPDDLGTVADESLMTPIVIDLGITGVPGAECWAVCEDPAQPTPNAVETCNDNGDGHLHLDPEHRYRGHGPDYDQVPGWCQMGAARTTCGTYQAPGQRGWW